MNTVPTNRGPMKLDDVIADLRYQSYAANRTYAPHIEPRRWARLFGDITEYEARYQAEKAINRARNFCQEEE